MKTLFASLALLLSLSVSSSTFAEDAEFGLSAVCVVVPEPTLGFRIPATFDEVISVDTGRPVGSDSRASMEVELGTSSTMTLNIVFDGTGGGLLLRDGDQNQWTLVPDSTGKTTVTIFVDAGKDFTLTPLSEIEMMPVGTKKAVIKPVTRCPV
ncbi:hypothetical protein ACNOYE_24960 [Nannocystaceae bacterium ST9]